MASIFLYYTSGASEMSPTCLTQLCVQRHSVMFHTHTHTHCSQQLWQLNIEIATHSRLGKSNRHIISACYVLFIIILKINNTICTDHKKKRKRSAMNEINVTWHGQKYIRCFTCNAHGNIADYYDYDTRYWSLRQISWSMMQQNANMLTAHWMTNTATASVIINKKN